ncbi:MAG TPA: glycosyltransferase family 4 protein [Gaiellaceae bacterium]|nr:glycosyltransferase family 4 protein [Gaiellaceae bacterium]
MRVALVCPYSWSFPGGVQTHVGGLAEALRDRGVEAEILAPADGPVDADGFHPLGRSIGFTWEGTVTRVALLPSTVARAARVVRARRFDVVHVHEPMLPAAGLTAVWAARAPVVGTFHMVARRHFWYRVWRPVVEPTAQRLAARIAVSVAARDFAAQAFPGPYELIPNAIDTHAFAAGERDGTRIVFVGRAEPRKGLSVLLDALARLPEHVTLDLVGVQGSFGPRVRAHGRVSDGERRRLLAEADVLCAPSLGGESFGVVLVEGMAAGLPVVASDIEGYRAVLPPEAGRLVPPGDAGALAAELEALVGDAQLRARLGGAARREAQRYDWDNVVGRVLEVYERALRRR